MRGERGGRRKGSEREEAESESGRRRQTASFIVSLSACWKSLPQVDTIHHALRIPRKPGS